MCAAAATFLGVGTVRYLAPDPWALAAGQPAGDVSAGPAAGVWVVTANLLFLLGVASRAGAGHPTVPATRPCRPPDRAGHPTVAGNRALEPETAGLVLDMVAEGLVAGAWTSGRSPAEALSARWGLIVAAAAALPGA